MKNGYWNVLHAIWINSTLDLNKISSRVSADGLHTALHALKITAHSSLHQSDLEGKVANPKSQISLRIFHVIFTAATISRPGLPPVVEAPLGDSIFNSWRARRRGTRTATERCYSEVCRASVQKHSDGIDRLLGWVDLL